MHHVTNRDGRSRGQVLDRSRPVLTESLSGWGGVSLREEGRARLA